MSGFNDFISLELPKRPFTAADGQAGQMLVRSSNAQAARELVWQDIPAVSEGVAVETISRVNTDTVTLWRCTPVIIGTNSDMRRASSGNITAVQYFGGLIYEDGGVPVGTSGRVLTSGRLAASTSDWDNVLTTTGGLVTGNSYYVGASGKLTADSSEASGALQFVGTAVSPTEMLLRVDRPIFL